MCRRSQAMKAAKRTCTKFLRRGHDRARAVEARKTTNTEGRRQRDAMIGGAGDKLLVFLTRAMSSRPTTRPSGRSDPP
jgi:hypothetical protein